MHDLVQFLDWHRRVRIHFAETVVIGALSGVDQFLRFRKFGYYAVESSLRHDGSAFAVGMSCRTSKMEIIGRKRTNSAKRKTKSPTEPKIAAKSQNVPWKFAHEEGRKRSEER